MVGGKNTDDNKRYDVCRKQYDVNEAEFRVHGERC